MFTLKPFSRLPNPRKILLLSPCKSFSALLGEDTESCSVGGQCLSGIDRFPLVLYQYRAAVTDLEAGDLGALQILSKNGRGERLPSTLPAISS